ncbi:MAG: CDP-alcohol phosphatidyltransferase family protein [Candidatus Rariloculaceae bacterium]
MTLYDLKPRFQDLLRPLVAGIARAGVTANQVTLLAALVSVALGVYVSLSAQARWVFLLIPVWLFLRMALNAIDGMLAREFDQKTSLGAYLNELTDAVSDSALYLPFAFIEPFSLLWVGFVVLLATLSEFAGALAPMIGVPRQYAGPMGKSDSAFVFGGLGLWVGLELRLPAWMLWVMPLIAALLIMTIVNRVRAGVRAADQQTRAEN